MFLQLFADLIEISLGDNFSFCRLSNYHFSVFFCSWPCRSLQVAFYKTHKKSFWSKHFVFGCFGLNFRFGYFWVELLSQFFGTLIFTILSFRLKVFLSIFHRCEDWQNCIVSIVTNWLSRPALKSLVLSRIQISLSRLKLQALKMPKLETKLYNRLKI